MVGSIVGAGAGENEGIGLVSMEGKAEEVEVGKVVEGGHFGLGGGSIF